MRKEKNRYDNFKNIFYKNVQKGYLKISKKKLNKYSIIDKS